MINQRLKRWESNSQFTVETIAIKTQLSFVEDTANCFIRVTLTVGKRD